MDLSNAETALLSLLALALSVTSVIVATRQATLQEKANNAVAV
jgi:hypothetical protein